MIAQRGRKASTGITQSGIFLRFSEARTYDGTGLGGTTASSTGATAAGRAAAAAGSTELPASLAAAGAASPPPPASPPSPPPRPSAARRSRERFSRCSGTSVTDGLRAGGSGQVVRESAPSPVPARTLGHEVVAEPRQGPLRHRPIARADRL